MIAYDLKLVPSEFQTDPVPSQAHPCLTRIDTNNYPQTVGYIRMFATPKRGQIGSKNTANILGDLLLISWFFNVFIKGVGVFNSSKMVN